MDSGVSGWLNHRVVNFHPFGLIRLWFQSLGLRLWYGLGQYVFFLISFLVVGSLFFYIFADFFSHKLPSLDPALQQQAHLWFCYILSGLVAVLLVGRIRTENHVAELYQALEAYQVGLSFWSYRYGESRGAICVFKITRAAMITLAIAGGGFALTCWLFPLGDGPAAALWPWFHGLAAAVAMLVGLNISLVRQSVVEDLSPRYGWVYQLSSRCIHGLIEKLPVRIRAAVIWKWRLMWRGSPLTRGLLRVMLLICVMSVGIAALGGHWLEILGVMWFASLVGSYSLLAFEADAMRAAIYQKLAGLTHRDYLMALSIVTYGVSCLAWLVSLPVLVVCSLVFDSFSMWMAIKIVLAAHLPLLLVPSLVFQVDARRPLLNSLMIVLSSLFLGTAILAHIGFGLLVIVLGVAAWISCEDRFHRA